MEMTDNTINNDMTMSGATGTLLGGRYRVVRQLGQGGMGSVWLAEDEKLDGFKVAIKMLPSVLVNNKRAYSQVKAEALVSLKLSHPNIATVRAFEEESGSPFLVMDYIDGQTLDDYLAEKGKLTEEETVKLLKPVAAALDYAHSQGVVHRDVKPGNVMIRRDGTPFVLDFGIAREIQETMTRVTGKLSSGTLLYMSPEQLNGDASKPAQDIYSFAAMAYECLKGEPPFIRGGIEDQIKHKTPETLCEHIAISSQVMAGLAKVSEDRPGCCAAVLEEDGKRVALGDADASSSKIRIAVVGALLALAALVGIGGWLWRGKLKSGELAAERARQVEIAAREAARRKAETERIAAEKIETERRAEDKRQAEEVRIAAEAAAHKAKADAERVAEEKRKAEEMRFAAEKAEAARKTKFEANGVEKCEEGVQLWENGPYWAECNVGATRPEEFGYYFCWGDTVGRKRVGDRWDAVDGSRIGVSFSSENCPTSGKDISQLQLAGYVGSTGSLVAKHDAATAYLGASWRMPTDAELEALVSNCDNEWATRNGVTGRLVKGRGAYSERRVFFPAAGIGEESTIFFPGSLGGYLSSTPYSEKVSSVCFLSVSSFSFNRGFNSRSNGWSVRPVRRRIEQNGVGAVKPVERAGSKGLAESLQTANLSRVTGFSYAYIAKLIPYVVENGVKRGASVSVSCGDSRLNAEVCNNEGQSVVLIGTNVRLTGAVAVNLSTSSCSRRTWLSASDFSTNGHPMPIEVEIK